MGCDHRRQATLLKLWSSLPDCEPRFCCNYAEWQEDFFRADSIRWERFVND